MTFIPRTDDNAGEVQEQRRQDLRRDAVRRAERAQLQRNDSQRRASIDAMDRAQSRFAAGLAQEGAAMRKMPDPRTTLLAREALRATSGRQEPTAPTPKPASMPPSAAAARSADAAATRAPSPTAAHVGSPMLLQALQDIASVRQHAANERRAGALGEAGKPDGAAPHAEPAPPRGPSPARADPPASRQEANDVADAGAAEGPLPGAVDAAADDAQALEARLAFIESFYDEALQPHEAARLAQALATARSALPPATPARPAEMARTDPSPGKAADAFTAADAAATNRPGAASRSALAAAMAAADDAADEVDADAAAWADQLADRACQALADGVPPAQVLAQLVAHLPHTQPMPRTFAAAPPAGGTAATLRAGGPEATRTPDQAVCAALHQACHALPEGDERRALLETLLHQGAGTDRNGAGAADAHLQDAATQQNIDARRANDTLPLATLRAV